MIDRVIKQKANTEDISKVEEIGREIMIIKLNTAMNIMANITVNTTMKHLLTNTRNSLSQSIRLNREDSHR